MKNFGPYITENMFGVRGDVERIDRMSSNDKLKFITLAMQDQDKKYSHDRLFAYTNNGRNKYSTVPRFSDWKKMTKLLKPTIDAVWAPGQSTNGKDTTPTFKDIYAVVEP
jgi:hypothetical protein